MQEHQQISAASSYILLVGFRWNESSEAFYARHIEDIVVDGDTFESVPTMEASLKKPMEGGAGRDEASLSMPLDPPPINTAIQPFKHSAIEVDIFEFSIDDPTSKRVLFTGTVEKIEVSPAGSRAFAKLSLMSSTYRLEQFNIGMQALSSCLHTFGDDDCGFDFTGKTKSFTVAEVGVDDIVTRIRLQMDNHLSVSERDPSRWARGFVKVDGVPITIRSLIDVDGGIPPDVTLDLRRPPSPSWFGKTGTMFPGCNKSIEACRDPFRDREESFLAPGIAMLPYNPAFQDSPSG